MAFTDFCDVFGSFHEEGFNRIVRHLQLQRPSLFNYGTADMVGREQIYCHEIEAHPAVTEFNNPLITESPYLPIPGYAGSFGMSYLMQLTKVEIDFEPSNVINLPSELEPPLREQQFALQASFCVGMGCPERRILDYLGDANLDDLFSNSDYDFTTGKPENGIPFQQLNCFCLDVHAVLHVERRGGAIALRLDGFEITDIRPEGLENGMECYIETILRLSILPKIRIQLTDLVFDIQDFITVQPTPISSDVPFNPAIQEDAISVFINLN